MSLFGDAEATFENRIHGTVGRFSSPVGSVNYLMAKARLGSAEETSDERRLTQHLHPVRELLSLKDLTFGQLLQRDLDDVRVADELVPYLLGRQEDQQRPFFPPVTAVLLPFSDSKPSEAFPETESEPIREIDGSRFRRSRTGASYAVDVLVDSKGDPAWPSVGRLHWNSERARLVVIDGQHRAMALLAVHRTRTQTWKNSPYEVLYRDRVNQLLEDASEEGLAEVEVPVTICWFPSDSNPHLTARSLFVALNKSARQPTDSRVLLLSDAMLMPAFVRRILDEAKTDGRVLWLPVVEYDQPTDRPGPPQRWSSLTTIDLLKHAATTFAFGPGPVIRELNRSPGGPGRRNDQFMRDSLALADVLPNEFTDASGVIVQRGSIGDRNFPRDKQDVIVDQFWNVWGAPISTILADVLPHRAHISALRALETSWEPGAGPAALVHRGIFEGSGLYWTARASSIDVDQIESTHKKTFTRDRAAQFMSGEGFEEEAALAFEVFRTMACQLGLLLTFRTLADRAGWDTGETRSRSAAFVDAVNRSLVGGPEPYGRRLFITASEPGDTSSLNGLVKMEIAAAKYFRYFWLELLAVEPGWDDQALVDRRTLTELATEGRSVYFDHLVSIRAKALRAVAKLGDPPVEQQAVIDAASDLRRRLEHSLGVSRAKSRELLLALSKVTPDILDAQPAGPPVSTGDDDDDAEPEEET